MNLRSFGDRLVWDSILVCKRLDRLRGYSFWPQRVWVPRLKRTSYKLIFGVFIVLEYYIFNFRPFGDRLDWVSILVRKRLDLRPVLEVQFDRKGFGYLDIREQPIN